MSKSTISAFQKTLEGVLKDTRPQAESFPEEFALKRFFKKLEVPNSAYADERKTRTFENWLQHDRGLPTVITLPHGVWYRARLLLQSWLTHFRVGSPEFTPGSSFEPTRGCNSVEAKLCGPWTVTRDCFEAAASVAYLHSGIKRAVRKRWAIYLRKHGINGVALEREYYQRYRTSKYVGFNIFREKLRLLVVFVEGSRFSTVRKDNEVDRPIDVQPFFNSLVQNAIASGFADVLKGVCGIDLGTQQAVHRERVKDSSVATVDLKSASDSNTIALCRFLLPQKVFNLLMLTRAQFVLGLDGQYYATNKICSMGCGWCFSLETLVFLALARSLDPKASCYGDDIIIDKSHASTLITALTAVGFTVNTSKTFLEGPFRESCGANYHDKFGYIASFDFRWPESIHDCVTFYNKCVALSDYSWFEGLEKRLRRCVPSVLRGGRFLRPLGLEFRTSGVSPDIDLLPAVFAAPPVEGADRKTRKLSSTRLDEIRRHLNVASLFEVTGFKFVPEERSPVKRHLDPTRNWAKFLMYLSAGRRSPDVITGRGRWVEVLYLSDGQRCFRASAFRYVGS